MNFAQFHTEPFGLKVAKGKVDGHKAVHKFGATNLMSNNTYGTIWDVDDTLYPWFVLDQGPLVVEVVPASSADIEKSITIEGLDENWNLVSEEVTTNSDPIQPIGVSTTQFRRIFRAYVTNGIFIDDVEIKRGGPTGTTVARVRVSKAQTLMSIYTIPDGYTGFLSKFATSIQTGGDAEINLYARRPGELDFRVAHSIEITGGSGPYVYDFPVPLSFPARTDIDVRAETRSNNARITSTFDIMLQDVDNIRLER